MEIKKSKKYIISLLITVFGLVALISSASYAILIGSTSSSNIHIVKAGSIELQVEEKYNNIEIGSYALKDTDGLIQEDIYEFTITNIGSAAAKYDLKLMNTAPSGQTALSSDYIRIGLEVNGQEMGPMGLSNVNNVIDSNTINNGEVIRYKMRIWLDKSKEAQIQNNSDKKAYLSIKVEAKQSAYKQTEYIYRWSNQSISIGNNASSITGGVTNPSSLNKSFYLKHTIDESKVKENYVCYILNNNEYCLKGVAVIAYDLNKQILSDSFGLSNCTDHTTYYECSYDTLSVRADSNGGIDASISNESCSINNNSSSSCTTS